MRGDFPMCWYWWDCWRSLFILYFYKVVSIS